MNTSLLSKYLVFSVLLLLAITPPVHAEEITLSTTFQEAAGRPGTLEVTMMVLALLGLDMLGLMMVSRGCLSP